MYESNARANRLKPTARMSPSMDQPIGTRDLTFSHYKGLPFPNLRPTNRMRRIDSGQAAAGRGRRLTPTFAKGGHHEGFASKAQAVEAPSRPLAEDLPLNYISRMTVPTPTAI